MAWIKLHQQVPGHPKTKRLVRALGLRVPEDIPQAVGHLCMFWLWCIDFAPDGDLTRFSDQDIADAAGWPEDPATFVQAMREAEFLDEGRVHDWQENGGRNIDQQNKERERNRQKQARHRERMKAAVPTPKPETSAEPETPNPFIDQEWLKVVKCYEANIGMIPIGKAGEILYSYYEDMGVEVMCKAIETTNKNQPMYPKKYLDSILKKWTEQKIDTVEKADAYILDLERRIEASKAKRQPVTSGGSEPPAISGDFY